MQQPTTPAAQTAMEALTAQWYNAVVKACHLDPTTFQLAQGFPLLGNTSRELWTMMDALPPHSPTHIFNPAQMSQFSSTYGAILSALNPPSDAAFVKAMGDEYSPWTTYKRSIPISAWPEGSELKLFNEWRKQYMKTGEGVRAYNLLAALMESPVYVATELWQNAQTTPPQPMAYDKTVAMLNTQLEGADLPVSVHMDSATDSSDMSHSWAKGQMGGLFDFFTGAAQAEYDKLTTQIASAGVVIDATFDRQVTFSFGPLSAPQTTDSTLATCRPWYTSSVLATAYQEPTGPLWGQGPPNWEQAFGAQGTLSAVKTGLVIVRGLTTTITSAVSFDSADETTIKAAAEFGFFPFFEAQASGGWEHNVEFHDAGGMSITSHVPDSEPVVLGAIITPASSLFGGGSKS
jgi:hypothetical protein